MTAMFSRFDLIADLNARLEAQISTLEALHREAGLGTPDRSELRHVILRGQMALGHPSPRRKEDALQYARRFHGHVLRKLQDRSAGIVRPLCHLHE